MKPASGRPKRERGIGHPAERLKTKQMNDVIHLKREY